MKLTMECEDCGRTVEMRENHTLLYIFEQQTFCSFLESTCGCGCSNRRFAVEEEITHIIREGWAFVSVIKPSQDTLNLYLAQDGNCTISQITPTLERQIKEFAEALKNAPDELLMDLFSCPPPKSTLPKRWI